MRKRLLAIGIALCLLAGVPSFAAGPTLVCRFTGRPMPPVAATPETHRSCCAVAAITAGDGSVRYALTRPGCCDLRQAPERVPPPAVPAPETVAAFLVPAPPIPVAATVEAAAPAPAANEAAPRAPPLWTASPRAPPSFS